MGKCDNKSGFYIPDQKLYLYIKNDQHEWLIQVLSMEVGLLGFGLSGYGRALTPDSNH